jgi:glyoxylase I family protein
MPGRIHHIDLTVADLARSTEFYARVLALFGFRRIADIDGEPMFASVALEIGLQLARGSWRRRHDRYSPGLHHLAFAAASRAAVDDAHQRLVELRVEILDPPADYPQYAPGYYALFFADPDGLKLEYVHTPK